MITTVTMNAAIDKTYVLDAFQRSAANRVQTMHALAGGKGINVARVAHTLGFPVMATGFIAGNNGAFIQNDLVKAGISNDFHRSNAGESRLCLNIISRADGSSTELLEPGPTLTPEDLQQIKNKVAHWAKHSKIVALSGSLPPGVPHDFYVELIAIAKQHGALAFLDTSGEALKAGVTAVPYFMKPNEHEVKALLEDADEFQPLSEEPSLLACIRKLMDQGIACVVVTLGESGALAGINGRCYRVHAPKVDVLNVVGCGDSFVAAFAVAHQRGWDDERCLRYATATASANAMTAMAGVVDPVQVDLLLNQVVIESRG